MQISPRASLHVLDATADLTRPYVRERLWFVRRGDSVFAVMAVSSDDAWMDVDGGFPSRADVECLCHGMDAAEIILATDRLRGLHGIPEWYGTEVPRTDSGQYLGLSRSR